MDTNGNHVYIYILLQKWLKTVNGASNGFKVKVGMHQGSALSPWLFVIVTEGLSREFRVTLSWELLYMHDLVVTAKIEDDLIKRLNEWKDNMENRVMSANMNKTKVMISEKGIQWSVDRTEESNCWNMLWK